MERKDLRTSFSQLEPINNTANELQIVGSKIAWNGLIGSSRSICAAAVAQQAPGNHLFLLGDKEEAAYFLNDLQEMHPDQSNILFYPASYRVPYEIENTDNANVVSRAEVLEKINSGKNLWIVTYPKALFEKIPSKKVLNQNTLKLEVGKSYSIDFINEILMELHFDRVDFVYEPGQFSIRGGIVDVYSYSNDEPFRIEFFG
ncbi:transcription-repair coupling factor, partial [Crocinitomicaceae bacterium]|nr:transcription-repair coupling factor [Crocinitomicaceae bacterium]